MDQEEEAPVRLLHTSDEKIAEVFSTTVFRAKVASLKSDLSTFSALECAHKFTYLLQDFLPVQHKGKVRNRRFLEILGLMKRERRALR